MTILFTWPTLSPEPMSGWHLRTLFPRAIGCLRSHAPVSLADWPYRSVSDLRKSCTAVHCMMPSFCMCTPRKEIGLIMRHIRPQERSALQIFTQNSPVKIEIVHILVIITAVTQNHGNCRKSRHKAKITVITAIVNSWFTYIPKYCLQWINGL